MVNMTNILLQVLTCDSCHFESDNDNRDKSVIPARESGLDGDYCFRCYPRVLSNSNRRARDELENRVQELEAEVREL